ncbi:uncharacterized protein LOC117106784 [Anneissia japonica]|uniref:uncharacterized protein LOC117106784 n=1 Tax=Anneissia japonica TaxID=1529436 RepID=UPI0014257D69|nr:uncharacterized protein LOC117106784 [Anneissia japonica]
MADRRTKTKHVKKQQISDKKLEEDLLKQFEELKLETTDPKPARITLSLIAKRNLPAALANGPQENLIESLAKISHVRLDRENIKHIDNLEMLGPVTNLYLQQRAQEGDQSS